jgi:Cytochrome c553
MRQPANPHASGFNTQPGVRSTKRKTRHAAKAVLGLGLALFSLAAYAATQAAMGADIAQHGAGSSIPACIACHGAKGEGNAAAGFPRLAGLPAAYIAAQLHSFAQGARVNSLMSPMAKALNDGQVTELADYYSSLPAPPRPMASSPQPRKPHWASVWPSVVIGARASPHASVAMDRVAWASRPIFRRWSGNRRLTSKRRSRPGKMAADITIRRA